MNAPGHRAWLPAVLLVGLVYFAVGRLFARPADHVQAWRLAAWLVSAIAYGGHIAYEQYRLRSRPRVTATHVALAAAIGAAGLALAALVHSWPAGAFPRPARLLAFAVWPAITGIPAFLVALALATILTRLNVSRE